MEGLNTLSIKHHPKVAQSVKHPCMSACSTNINNSKELEILIIIIYLKILIISLSSLSLIIIVKGK